ncbi:hypothetical protein JCM3765_003828 [Sporobolomyces pararoseus]
MPSISCLPNELLESIFDFVHDKTAEPTITSQKTFASLALTSKLFLPLARSRLYYRPISPSTPVSWRSALYLVAALTTPLGNLVVSLEGIVDFVAQIGQLDEPSYRLSFQLVGYTKTFSLYYKILSSCRQLVSVEIICDSTKHLSKLLNALHHSIPTLRTVKFANSVYSGEYCIDGDLVCQALSRLSAWSIDKVILDNVDYSRLSDNPLGPLALQSFSIKSSLRVILAFKQIFPRDSTSLSSISVETNMSSESDLIWIFEYLPSTLRQLTLEANDSHMYGWHPPQSLQHYQLHVCPSLPPSKLSRFTSLTRVSLRGFDGPSLTLLDTLVSSSPGITLLRFECSHWVNLLPSSTSFPIVDDSIPSLLDPDALLSCLLKFEKLKSVHLGVLPTKKRETFRELEEEMEEKRGIKVEWQLCL